jgi:cytochrome c peroxidase/DNA-binding beta-propeller fold protein YncE
MEQAFPRLWAVILFLAASAGWLAVADQAPPTPLRTRLRHPVAVAFLDEARTLCVANRRGGSLSLVDVSEARVRDEIAVGPCPSDLAVLPDRKQVLVTDEQRHELIALTNDGGTLRVRGRVAVHPYPVSVVVVPDGTQATVASLWSRRLEVVDLARLRVWHTIPLPFAPRLQCAVPRSGLVIVADSFGGRLAVVDAVKGRLVTIHELNGHNIRGLALSSDGKELLIAHQVLDQTAPTTREHIERGILLTNVLRVLPLERVLTPGGNLPEAGRVLRLDGPDTGAGDPAGVAVLGDEQVAVALAGVGEVALLRADKVVRRIGVGRRPTVLLPDGSQTLICLNTLDDSLSLLDLDQGRAMRTISLGPRPDLEPKDRGELLFHDARLSHQGRLSCQSCHTDGHTSGLLADTLGDKTYGTPKRILTLMNTALTDPWAWNGEMKSLHDQVQQSIRETMHGPPLAAQQLNDMVSFLHTLPAPPPAEPVTADDADRAQVERGRLIFQSRGCVHCHIPPLTYTSPGTHDVGYEDERGLRNFNAPSLRGVSQNARFLHDNRAATLEEVFTKFRHKVRSDMPAADRTDLLRFLRSL